MASAPARRGSMRPPATQLPARAAGDRRLALRALAALALANVRYWSSLAPLVRRQLRDWRRHAAAVEDPELRALALAKLRAERFNAEAAVMAAALAPSAHRRLAAQAILALELLFDYLDGLTERPLLDPLGDGERLYASFLDAIPPRTQSTVRQAADAGDLYLRGLAHAARTAIVQLPAGEAILPATRRCALHGAQAQIRMHAVPALGVEQLRAWARSHADGGTLAWRESLAAAACSVLAMHALIAAGADPRTTPERAEEIYAAYLPICAAVTLLDGLVDRQRDALLGQPSYIGLYEHPELLAAALTRAARESRHACRTLRGGGHHAMMLAGTFAYWLSTPDRSDGQADSILAELQGELGILLLPALLLMRAWRAGRRMGAVRRPRARAETESVC